MKNSQKGFSLVEIVLVLLVAGLIGVVGFMVYNNYSNKGDNNKESSSNQVTDPYADWNKYENKDLGFRYYYPKDWRTENSTGQCAASAADFGASYCPISGSLNPQAYVDYQNKKYSNLVLPLAGYDVFQKSSQSLESLYQTFKTEYASQEGFSPKPSELITVNGLKGFYVNQKTNSYSDNIYVIQLSVGTYIKFSNRESDKSYNANGSINDQNDYTSYTATVDKIVKSLAAL